MTKQPTPDLPTLAGLVQAGEGPTLEFKRSTGELREAMQTVCAFLNGSGGSVLFGIRPDGTAEGQQVTDQTLRDIAQALDKFEPPVNLPVERLAVGHGREVLMLRVAGPSESAPFDYDSRPYERVGSTTRKMPQESRLPAGVTVDQLSGSHLSELRNPLIAEAFHRTGAVEIWGRGTNRVIAECKSHGIAPPTFEERQGFLMVTFKAPIAVSAALVTARVRGWPESATQSATQSTDPVERLLAVLQRGELSAGELRLALTIKHRPTFRANYLHPTLKAGLIEHTLPGKPNSRLQKYRLTPAGRQRLECLQKKDSTPGASERE
jgi:predicted HTH transcriptional regulator